MSTLIDPNTTATAKRILSRWDADPAGATLADRLSHHADDVALEVYRVMREEREADDRESMICGTV